MVDLFHSKLTFWKTMNLSLGGRLTLIKFVLYAIPIYSLAICFLPVRIRNSLQSIMPRLLWGGGLEDGRKLHLID